MKSNDLEERLINFSVKVILSCKNLDSSFASEHLAKQIIRSSTSAALNYGEARSAESSRDFSHKMKLCLKELRECYVNLHIQKGAQLIAESNVIEEVIQENNELISIFVSSIKTVSKKNF